MPTILIALLVTIGLLELVIAFSLFKKHKKMHQQNVEVGALTKSLEEKQSLVQTKLDEADQKLKEIHHEKEKLKVETTETIEKKQDEKAKQKTNLKLGLESVVDRLVQYEPDSVLERESLLGELKVKAEQLENDIQEGYLDDNPSKEILLESEEVKLDAVIEYYWAKRQSEISKEFDLAETAYKLGNAFSSTWNIKKPWRVLRMPIASAQISPPFKRK